MYATIVIHRHRIFALDYRTLVIKKNRTEECPVQGAPHEDMKIRKRK